MNAYLTKLRFVFLPYLMYLVIFLIGYTLLNWLFVIELEWITLDGSIIDVIGPMGIGFLLVITLLRPVIRRLHFKNDKASDFFYFMATVGIAVPTIIAQVYLSTATGTLTSLENISQIDSLPKTKYYTLKHYYFYKNGVSIKEDIRTSGKYNQYMNFTVYCVMPILRTPQDTMAGATHYWLCTKYTDQISNYISDSSKKAHFEEFIKLSEQKFRLEGFPFTYLERIGHGEDAKYFGHAASRNKWSRDGADILLITHEGDFAQRNGNKLGWIFKSSGIVLIVFALLLLCYRLKTPAELKKVEQRIARNRARGWKKNNEWLLPREGFYVTPFLLYANILMYVFMVLGGLGFVSFSGNELIDWGSLYKSYVLIQGEWWRLLTYMFLHGGIVHILNNLISLYFVGIFLEPLLGKWRLLLVYVLCGICAGITSLIWHDQVNTVGASGAIFGLYGFMLALIMMKVTSPQLNKFFFIIASVSVGFSLLMGLFGNIDNAAHIGGLISGFMLGFLLSDVVKRNSEKGSA